MKTPFVVFLICLLYTPFHQSINFNKSPETINEEHWWRVSKDYIEKLKKRENLKVVKAVESSACRDGILKTQIDLSKKYFARVIFKPRKLKTKFKIKDGSDDLYGRWSLIENAFPDDLGMEVWRTSELKFSHYTDACEISVTVDDKYKPDGYTCFGMYIVLLEKNE